MKDFQKFPSLEKTIEFSNQEKLPTVSFLEWKEWTLEQQEYCRDEFMINEVDGLFHNGFISGLITKPIFYFDKERFYAKTFGHYPKVNDIIYDLGAGYFDRTVLLYTVTKNASTGFLTVSGFILPSRYEKLIPISK